MRRLFTALLLLVLLAVPAKARTLRIVSLEAPPLVYSIGRNTYGALVDVVVQGLARMGHDVEIQLMPWSRALASVRYGDADAIFYAIRTPEREEYLHFPEEPLWQERTVAVQLINGSVPLDADLANARNVRLGVGRGYYYGPRLEKLMQGGMFAAVEPVVNAGDNLKKLLGGRIDAFLTDYLNALKLLRDHAVGARLEIVSELDGRPAVLGSYPSYLAFSREAVPGDMAQSFSAVLQEMKRDGTYEKIMSHYMLDALLKQKEGGE